LHHLDGKSDGCALESPLHYVGVVNEITPIANSDVWMDGESLEQLARAARIPGCEKAVGMPDLHAGPGGLPIGVALAFTDRIVPGLLGSDVGCGARLVVTTLRTPSLDRLERRLEGFLVERPWSDDPDLGGVLLAAGARGVADLASVPAAVARLLAEEPSTASLSANTFPASLLDPIVLSTIGSIGGGNHFAEVVVIDEILDESVAAERGVEHGRLAVLVHSGSRAVGKALAENFPSGEIPLSEAAPYLAAHDWACRVAAANRALVAAALLGVAEAARPSRISAVVDAVHNQVVPLDIGGRIRWVHRKGAASAVRGEPTLLLGSRGARSYLMIGEGNPAGLCSMAHGAGRRLHRAEAYAKMRARHSRMSLLRTPLGGRVVCDRTELLYEEHPDVYKAIGPVLDSIVGAGLARPVAALRPLLTVKR
jgi:release factor H-coupled RctB family protein